MLFRDVVGQNDVKARLIRTVREGRVSHAQLFTGPEGCGNLALAIAYARYVSCENRTETDACGQCASCVKYHKLAHPDLHFIFPVAGPKAAKKSADVLPAWREAVAANPYLSLEDWHHAAGMENKQSVITVEESAEIVRQVNLQPYESPYKTLIIWMPERLNIAAANKLLKVLEEPPGSTLFILVATNADALPPTILSRLMAVNVPRLRDEDIAAALTARYGLTGEEARRAAFLSDGNFNTAMTFSGKGPGPGVMTDTFINWMRLCFAYNPVALTDWVDGIAKTGREKHRQFLLYALRIVRECLLLDAGLHTLVRLDAKEDDFMRRFSRYVRMDNGPGMAERLNRACAAIERNANPKILFLDLSLEVGTLLRGEAVAG